MLEIISCSIICASNHFSFSCLVKVLKENMEVKKQNLNTRGCAYSLFVPFSQLLPPFFFATESNHPLSLRSLASQCEGCSEGLQQTWQSSGMTPCCSLGHTSSFAKSNNTFSELRVRFKWGSTMQPTLSSPSRSFSLCARVWKLPLFSTTWSFFSFSFWLFGNRSVGCGGCNSTQQFFSLLT